MTSIDRLLDDLDALAPLSPTASRLANVVGSEKSSVDDIVGVLEFDQALTADALRFANSATSASVRKIASLKDAVIRLGGARILGHLVAHQLQSGFQTSLEGYGYGENELWHNSVAAALAAEQLGAVVRSPATGLAFTAALLHDIGKLLLVRFVPALTMERVWVVAEQGALPVVDAEKEVTGLTHAEVGAELCARWGLPGQLVSAVRYHHSCTESLEPVTDVVRLANVAARSMGEGVGNEGMSCSLDRGIDVRTGLTKETFERVCVLASDRLVTVLKEFGQ